LRPKTFSSFLATRCRARPPTSAPGCGSSHPRPLCTCWWSRKDSEKMRRAPTQFKSSLDNAVDVSRQVFI
jgi:hypothetical protein